MSIFSFRLISALFICLTSFTTVAKEAEQAAFVTSAKCQSCHTEQFANWQKSHHSMAWLQPAAENVLGNFNNASFATGGKNYSFTQKDGRYFITLDDQNGQQKTYPVAYTAGITPLQQYLLDTGKGRLQAPDVAWDVVNKRWFHLYPDADTSAGNGLHWSGSYKNWNARCAECHATGFQKKLTPRDMSYKSTQSEIGVGCESCHGAGEAHLLWAEKPQQFKQSEWQAADANGLLHQYDGSSKKLINSCSACHSRREAFNADSPPAGSSYHDDYRLSLLTDAMYFADGQIRDEVYVLGSFMQSKMYQRGVDCLDCHDAHSYQLKHQGNNLCTQCHNPQGNPGFPTLTKKTYDSAQHHFHPENSAGAQCQACHMPLRNYMVVDGRRDHSFKVPRPDLSVKLQTPNACNQCHTEQTAEWAAQTVQQHYPQGRHLQKSFAGVFHAARTGPAFSTAKQLLQIAGDSAQPEIVRASAVDHLRYLERTGITDKQFQALLQDSSALVRSAAVRLLRNTKPEKMAAWAASLLKDDNRAVRMDVAMGLLGADAQNLSDDARADLQKAVIELQKSLLSRADFPENQMVLGGLALTMKNLPAASQAFETAIVMDPQLVQAWRMLARIKAVEGDAAATKAIVEAGLRQNPDNSLLAEMLRQLQ